MADQERVSEHIQSIWPPLVLLVVTVGYVWWAQDYERVSRMMPTLVGLGTAVLAALDLVSRLNNSLGSTVRLSLGADFVSPEMSHDPPLRREAVLILALLGCVFAMMTIGILPTLPLFIIIYMRLWGGRPWLSSFVSAVVVLAFVFIVFELILDYQLYRGVLFDPRGLESW